MRQEDGVQIALVPSQAAVACPVAASCPEAAHHACDVSKPIFSPKARSRGGSNVAAFWAFYKVVGQIPFLNFDTILTAAPFIFS